MKVLFDTNVVLDVLMDRQPFADVAAGLFVNVEQGDIAGYLCSTTITTVYYLAAKALGAAQAQEEIRKLLTLFEVAPVTRPVLESALNARFADFEDAVVHEAAAHIGADAIVTRNQKDFAGAGVSVYTPSELAGIVALKRKKR